MHALWRWLADNGSNLQGLGALATIAAVIVAGYYAIVTRRIATAARAQAQTATLQARAAADQAQLARQLLQSADRPTIEMVFDPGMGARGYTNDANYYFPFRLFDHRTVPGVLAGWRGIIRRNGVIEVEGPLQDAGLAIFPGREAHFNFHGPPAPLGTKPERCYATEADAVKDGCRWSKR